MNKFLMLLAVAAIAASTTGCGCCGSCFRPAAPRCAQPRSRLPARLPPTPAACRP